MAILPLYFHFLLTWVKSYNDAYIDILWVLFHQMYFHYEDEAVADTSKQIWYFYFYFLLHLCTFHFLCHFYFRGFRRSPPSYNAPNIKSFSALFISLLPCSIQIPNIFHLYDKIFYLCVVVGIRLALILYYIVRLLSNQKMRYWHLNAILGNTLIRSH